MPSQAKKEKDGEFSSPSHRAPSPPPLQVTHIVAASSPLSDVAVTDLLSPVLPVAPPPTPLSAKADLSGDAAPPPMSPLLDGESASASDVVQQVVEEFPALPLSSKASPTQLLVDVNSGPMQPGKAFKSKTLSSYLAIVEKGGKGNTKAGGKADAVSHQHGAGTGSLSKSGAIQSAAAPKNLKNSKSLPGFFEGVFQ